MPRLARLAPLIPLAALTAPAVAGPTATAPVIGGTRTADGAFPGVGALLYSFGGQTMAGCTGTLIAPTVVLTAAHCLDPEVTGGLAPSGFTFDHDTVSHSPTPVYPVASAMKHAQFDINSLPGGLGQVYDIGLVFLSTPVTDVAPVRMPTAEQATALAVDTELRIVGYGQTSDADPNSTGVMFDAATGIRELNSFEMRVSSGTPDPQNCHGDSGGPALADFDGELRVVGVVSRSYQSGQCDNGGVDTRVDAYLPWIAANVPDGLPCGSGPAEACPVAEDDGGCCSTGGDRRAPGPLAIGAAVAAVLARRRRR